MLLAYFVAFSNVPKFCIAILCPNLTNPLDGHVVISNLNLTIGVIASYSCNSGYSLEGNGTVLCEQVDTVGVWSDTPPACSGKCELSSTVSFCSASYLLDSLNSHYSNYL